MSNRKSRLRTHSWGESAGAPHRDLRDMQKKSSLVTAKGGFFEVTLNFPRTAYFTSATSDQQKMMYLRVWDDIRNIVCPNAHHEKTFEYCKSGHVHLHGFIRIPDDFTLIPIGGIADIVKRFCTSYSANISIKTREGQIQKYDEKYMFFMDHVYKSPPICVRYRSSDQEERFAEWLDYMHKCVQN